MGIQVIEGHFLIESPPGESDPEFCAAVEGLIALAYSRRPDWLRFSPGARFTRGESYFREFLCMAGSVSCCLMLRAGRDGGLPRALIYRAEDEGVRRAYEIRGGASRQSLHQMSCTWPNKPDRANRRQPSGIRERGSAARVGVLTAAVAHPGRSAACRAHCTRTF